MHKNNVANYFWHCEGSVVKTVNPIKASPPLLNNLWSMLWWYSVKKCHYRIIHQFTQCQKNSCKFVRFYAWKRTYGGIFKCAGESTGSKNVSQAQSAIKERPRVSRRHWRLELIIHDITYVKNVCVVQKICLMNREMNRKK